MGPTVFRLKAVRIGGLKEDEGSHEDWRLYCKVDSR
jgi:hypothetical protein